MKSITLPWFLALLFFALVFPAAFAAAEQISLANEQIEVRVDKGNGRFTIRTTDRRDNVPLLCDRSTLTSYASIAFSGGKDLQEYGNKKGKFTQVPARLGSSIVSRWKYKDYEVRQEFTLVKGSEDGPVDCARIKYWVLNGTSVMQSIGVRILLDTAVGDKDGVPFKVPGHGLIESEYEISGNAVPQCWYSYDDYDMPNVRTIGVTRAQDAFPPDRIIFAAWRRLHGAPWNFKAKKGTSFSQALLSGKDSAVALYYESRITPPGASFEAETTYGLYSVQEESGKVFSIAMRVLDSIVANRPFAFTADVQNLSPNALRDCSFQLVLPDMITLDKGQTPIYTRSELASGETVNLGWDLRMNSDAIGEYKIILTALGLDGGKMRGDERFHTVNYVPPKINLTKGLSFFDPLTVTSEANRYVPPADPAVMKPDPVPVIKPDPVPEKKDPTPKPRLINLPDMNIYLSDAVKAESPERIALRNRLSKAAQRSALLEEKMRVLDQRRMSAMTEEVAAVLQNPAATLESITAIVSRIEALLDIVDGYP
ncbi:MAG: hypothetical protein LBC99_02750 [Spirochaetota bacterium]|nr:hypothetical protein [Spirochaetota bacterium]